jgi:hypothetical protein
MKLGLVATVSACVLLSACASVTRGSTDAWEVNSDPIGARVETTNGFSCEATPCAMRMKRKSEFVATVTKPGYRPATISVTHKTAKAGAAGMAGNVLVGGLIGVVVDSSTGATQDLVPNPAFVKLERAGPYDRFAEATPQDALPPPEPMPQPAYAPPPPPVPEPIPKVYPPRAPVYAPAPAPAPTYAPPPIYTPTPLAGAPIAAPPPPPPAPAVNSSNLIKGTAYLRTRNGLTRSCAGSPVRLFPRGPSTVAFVRQAYGSETGGFARRTSWEPQPFDPVVTIDTCDAQGGFAFDRLPDGDYYIAAVVSIETPAGNGGNYMVQEGGTIVSLVSVSGGSVKPIVLTR